MSDLQTLETMEAFFAAAPGFVDVTPAGGETMRTAPHMAAVGAMVGAALSADALFDGGRIDLSSLDASLSETKGPVAPQPKKNDFGFH